MHKQKRKNSFLSGQSRPFIILWGSAYLVALLISYFLTQQAQSIASMAYRDWLPRISLLFIFLAMSLPAVLQVQIVERLFKQSMRGWMRYNAVAAALVVITLNLFNPGTHWMIDTLLFNAPVYLVMSALAQTLWLWGRVKFAWLWMPISLFVSIAPPFAFHTTPVDSAFNVILLLVQSLVQGGLMYFLLTHPKESEKAKVDFDVDDQLSIDNRAARLQTSESPTVTWHTRDEQVAQHKAQ